MTAANTTPMTPAQIIDNLVDENGNKLMDRLSVPGETAIKLEIHCPAPLLVYAQQNSRENI
jgi:hypothetical protein